jgi:hypothetical protein
MLLLKKEGRTALLNPLGQHAAWLRKTKNIYGDQFSPYKKKE